MEGEEAADLSVLSFPMVAASIPVGLFVAVALLSQDSGPGLNKEFPLLFRLLAVIRTPMLMFIVVPLSFTSWMIRSIRDYIRRSFGGGIASNHGHDERCNEVVRQIQAWNKAGRPQKLRTARPNWAAMSTKLASNKESCALINTSKLNHILEINKEKMTITCEPMVTMGQITQQLLPLQLALKVQVEMESITIGGVALGFGLETNSHAVGFFQETVVAYKMVMSSGEVVTVTAESDPDLFYSIPWSHGSLGFLLSVTAQLIKVKPFVKITYIPTFSAKELQTKLQELTEQDESKAPTFVEATIFTKDKAVIQCGEFIDGTIKEEQDRMNGINYFWKPFYYKWVETFLEKGESWEVAPTKHFYHRFTRSIFWEIEDMIPFSNHPLYRCLWGWMGAPEVSLLKLFQGPVVRRASVYAHVVQESIMPLCHLEEGIKRFDEWYDLRPLLVFPIRIYNRKEKSGLLSPRSEHMLPGKNYGIYVDLGAYGVPREIKEGKQWEAKKHIRAMEHWTREKGGFQATYTDLFCTRKEFRNMFDHTLYDQQRKKWNCLDAFPEIYDKIKTEDGIVDLTQEEELERQKAK